MHLKISKFIRKQQFILLLTVLLSFDARSELFVESFGFNGQEWQFSYDNVIGSFNKRVIERGYTFVSFLNIHSNVKVDYFIVNNGKRYLSCTPNLKSIMPHLRNMVKAREHGDVELSILYESLAQGDLIFQCDRSYGSELEFKRRFNRDVAFSSMPGLMY